jgi:hypothetical protein
MNHSAQQQIYNTKDTFSTVFTERDRRQTEICSSSIDVNSVQRDRNKSPVIPRLNTSQLRNAAGSTTPQRVVAKPYQTRDTYQDEDFYSGFDASNGTFAMSNGTSRFNTNNELASTTSYTGITPPTVSINREMVIKSPIRKPLPSKHISKAPVLTGSSPYRYQTPVTTGNYIPGTQSTYTPQNLNATRLVASPIRTSTITGTRYPTSNVVRSSPYRVAQPSPARVMASPYRVQPSPGRIIASPSPMRTYGASPYRAPVYNASPLNLNAHNYSPIRQVARPAPIYTAPAYQHRPAPVAVRTPSLVQ